MNLRYGIPVRSGRLLLYHPSFLQLLGVEPRDSSARFRWCARIVCVAERGGVLGERVYILLLNPAERFLDPLIQCASVVVLSVFNSLTSLIPFRQA
jgi:hypothetical protein